MRIPRTNQPTPFLNRRDQYRMLAMVALLCLVIVAIRIAAKPSSWYWLLPPDAEGTKARHGEDVRLDELDFRVKESAQNLPPGVFRAVAATGEETRAGEEAFADGQASAERATVDVAIPHEQLTGIEDNTIGVHSAERDAYFLMLDRIGDLPDDVIAANARDDVAFTVIMLQSDDYRGQLVQLTGQLRRLTEYPVLPNDLGIDRLYEGWLFTNDSGNNPWRFVCRELPPGAPLGESFPPVKIDVTGYFFKRTGYASQGGQHVAPTLLARSFHVIPVPVSTAPQMHVEMRNWLLGFVGVVTVVLGLTMWRSIAGDRRFRSSRLNELASARLNAAAEDLQALQHVETIDPGRILVDGSEETHRAGAQTERSSPV